MQIECPSCKTDNYIDYSENIICVNCKKSFTGHVFQKIKKPLVSSAAALLIGIYGTYKIDNHFFDEQRLPIPIEYELIDSCVNSSNGVLRDSKYILKKKICSCALEQTLLEMNYKEMKNNESLFMTRYSNKIKLCS